MQQIPLAQIPKMGAVIDTIINLSSCLSQESQFVNLVPEYHLVISLKEVEHMKYADTSTGTDITGICRPTPIP